MTFENMITDVIVKTFNREFGKWQSKKTEPKVMVVSFSVSLKDGEEGYRKEDLALFASCNYVGVYHRERWDVIPEEDLEYNEDTEESYVKKGKDYIKGASPWELLVSHDSAWRSAIQSYLFKNRNRISGFDNSSTNNDIYTSIKPEELGEKHR